MNPRSTRRALRLVLLAGLGCATLPGQIQLHFNDAVAQATQNNPQLTAAAARVQSAEGLRLQAGLKPNPRAILQLENYRAWEQPPFALSYSPDNYVYATQLIERGHKRERRVDAADATVVRAQLERDLLLRQIRYRVAGAYWTAAAAEQVRRLWQQQVESYNNLVLYNENRLKEGVVAEADVLRAKVERNRALLSAANAQQEAVRARVTLYREMGSAVFPAVELDDPATPGAPVLIPAMDLVLETRYELRVSRQTVVEAESRVALQRANAKVDPDVSFGYKRTVGVDTLYGAISVPIAWRNRNQGNIAAAEADLRAAQANQRATENGIRAEVTAAQQEYELRRQLLGGTLPTMRQEAEETVRIARAAYREGGIDLLRLLDAERSRLDTEVLFYQTLSQFQQSVVNLQSAIGETPGMASPNNTPPNPNGARP